MENDDPDLPNDMLVEFEVETRRAQQEVLNKYLSHPLGMALIRRMISNPILRALLELELNGCTSYRGVRLLVAEGFASVHTFKARAKLLHSRTCEYTQMTNLGYATMVQEQEGLELNQFMSLFRGAILGYACVDYGQGICITRELFETCLELSDVELLKRAVHAADGRIQFPELEAIKGVVNEELRARSATWWSILDENAPRSDRILDLASV